MSAAPGCPYAITDAPAPCSKREGYHVWSRPEGRCECGERDWRDGAVT